MGLFSGGTTTTPSGAAGGDLTGTFPNPTVAALKITNAKVSATAAIDLSKLAATGYLGYVLLQDQETSGTNGGTATSGAWRTRVLNTEALDTNNDCTLASNAFTLAAGTYLINASAMAFVCDQHKTRLQNTTDASTVLLGTSEQATASNVGYSHSLVVGRFTIAAGKALELQHQVATTRATNGFGVASGFSVTEIYAQVELFRIS